MKRLVKYLLIITAASAAGCQKNESTETVPASINLINVQDNMLTVPSSAGTTDIQYELINPVEDGEIHAWSSDSSWIMDIDCSIAGSISFSVPTNNGEARSAVLTIQYSQGST